MEPIVAHPGQWPGNETAQRTHICANHTHAAAALLDRGINILAQAVASETRDETKRYRVSCNTDLTLDLLGHSRTGAGEANL